MNDVLLFFIICISVLLYLAGGCKTHDYYFTISASRTNWIVFFLWPLFAIGIFITRFSKDIKEIHEMLFWRKEKCVSCEYLKSVSNHSPCHECVLGNKYKRHEPKPIIEILKEAGFDLVDMEGKHENVK